MNFGGPTQPFPHTRGFNGCACLYISSKTSSAFGRRQPAGPPKLNKTRQQFSIQQQISLALREDSPPEKQQDVGTKSGYPFVDGDTSSQPAFYAHFSFLNVFNNMFSGHLSLVCF